MKIIQEKGMILRELENKHGRIDTKEKIKFTHHNYESKKEFESFVKTLTVKNKDVKKKTSTVFKKIVELNPEPDIVEIVISEKKIGKNNSPLKTGAKILEYNDLVFSNSKVFKSLSESIAFVRKSDSHKTKKRYFELIDFNKFKSNFKHYPYVYWKDRKKNVDFGPELKLKLTKESDEIELVFFDESGKIRFTSDEIMREEKKIVKNRIEYLPVYGISGNLGLILDDVIYPVNCQLSFEQLRRLHEIISGKRLEEMNLELRKSLDLEIFPELIIKGIEVDKSLFFDPLEISFGKPMPHWEISKFGDKYHLIVSFEYEGTLISFSDNIEFVISATDKLALKRNRKFETNSLRILNGFLQNEEIVNNLKDEFLISKEEMLDLLDIISEKDEYRPVIEFKNEELKLGKEKIALNIGVKSAIKWFEVDVDIKIGDMIIPLDKVKDMIEKDSKYVNIEDKFYKINPEEIDKLKMLIERTQENDSKFSWNNLDLLSTIEESGVGSFDEKSSDIINSLKNFKNISKYEYSDLFKGELRDYQKAGYQWLRFLHEYNLSGILADDMGLGKTVQTISLLAFLLEKNPEVKILILSPKSLINGWEEEIKRFCPSFSVKIYYGTQKEREILRENETNITITTYGTFRNDSDYFKSIEFDYTVVDEAQNLKNKNTQIFKSLKYLNTSNRLALTGTPIENSINDLKSIFDFIIPGFLGSDREFKSLYSSDDGFIRNKIRPLIMRRRKEEVLKELPPKTIKNLKIDMTDLQKELYYGYFLEAKREIEEKVKDESSFSKNRFFVLTHLLRLRQIASHPGLIDDSYMIQNYSGKMDALIELLKDIVVEGHKVLVFSQFSSMLKIIKKTLKENNLSSLYMDGSTDNRHVLVDVFKKSKEFKIMLMTLKVGGVGLNLTEADYVIMFDPWWNPAAENQAIDRTHRIGQENPVMVYRFISQGTIEEKIIELQESKNRIFKDIIDSQTDFEKKITAEDIKNMFKSIK